LVDIVIAIGKGNEHVTSLESIQVVKNVLLLKWMFVALSLLSSLVNLSSHLVEGGLGVHILPKGLSVVWIVTSRVALLTTVVVEWDTSGGHSEDESISKHGVVIVLVQESSVVVVVNENTERVEVLEVRLFLLPSALDVLHRFLASENIFDSIVHWVVEEASDMFLIWTNVSWITIEVLTHLENSSGFSELTPEVLWNFRNGIDSNTIKTEVTDEVFDPVFKITSDVVILLSKIRETSESAVLNLLLVAPVIDIAITMVMLLFVQWINLVEVVTDWGDVIGNNIDHHVNSFIVAGFNQVLEVIIRSEVGVSLLPVSGPVSVVPTVHIVNNWRDPNSIESHTLDVVKLVGDSAPGSSAVSLKVTA